MSATLYSRDILRLATAIPHLGRLDGTHTSAERRSPICGSRVRVDVRLDVRGLVVALAIDPNACALGQAACALMGNHAIGRSALELEQARAALADWLAGARDDPGEWPGLAVFTAAVPHTARHAAIRLAFEAAADAAKTATESAREGT